MTEIATVGLDLAKSWFQVHGTEAQGRPVLRKKLARGKVLAFFANLPPCLVGPPVPLGTGCVADGAAVGGWRPASAHPYRPAVAGRFRYADRIIGFANDGPAH